MDYFTKISELNAKKAGLIEKANALIDKGELGGELEDVKNEIKSTQGEIEKVSEIAALSEKTAKKSENKQGSRPLQLSENSSPRYATPRRVRLMKDCMP